MRIAIALILLHALMIALFIGMQDAYGKTGILIALPIYLLSMAFVLTNKALNDWLENKPTEEK
jgi:hypothetical protein